MKKFRVWSQEKNCWLNSVVSTDDGRLLVLFVEKVGDDKVANIVFTIDLLKPVIQYSSGMVDSKNVEIFDGDILEFNNERSFVMFCYGTFLIDGHGEFYDFVKSSTPDKLEDWIVIGNIFENKELLLKNENK